MQCIKSILKILKNMRYVVTDTTGHWLGVFPSYYQADCYRITKQRYDWKISAVDPYPEKYKADIDSTPKQKSAVSFCCNMLKIEFEGNINSFKQCSKFLSEYLEQAKQYYTELKCEFESDRGY